MTLTATLISINWGTYVVAIITGHGVEAALGYYINPLINVLLAAVFLGERPNRPQAAAIALAAFGVLILTVKAGGLPWISLILAGSFGLYGLLRKTVPVSASEGFFLEIAILFLPALGLAVWVASTGQNHFGSNGRETALLIGAGAVTAIPLILYAAAARLLRFTTVGLLQYIAPTFIALTAVFVFGEPFGLGRASPSASSGRPLPFTRGRCSRAADRRAGQPPKPALQNDLTKKGGAWAALALDYLGRAVKDARSPLPRRRARPAVRPLRWREASPRSDP